MGHSMCEGGGINQFAYKGGNINKALLSHPPSREGRGRMGACFLENAFSPKSCKPTTQDIHKNTYNKFTVTRMKRNFFYTSSLLAQAFNNEDGRGNMKAAAWRSQVAPFLRGFSS